jgi:hypothetical protein
LVFLCTCNHQDSDRKLKIEVQDYKIGPVRRWGLLQGGGGMKEIREGEYG